jgi:DNA-binding MarR family transcriptional regulator
VSDRTEPDQRVPEVELVDRLRTVISRGSRQLRLTYSDDSLSPSQHEVLAIIVRRGSMRLSELAGSEGLNPTMLSRIVAKLEDADLARRTPDIVDGRVVHLAATDRGRALYEVIRSQRTDALKFALEQMSPDEQRRLADALPVLESLVDALKQRGR